MQTIILMVFGALSGLLMSRFFELSIVEEFSIILMVAVLLSVGIRACQALKKR